MDLVARSVEPLADHLDLAELPLAGFLPAATVGSTFDALHLVDPVVTVLPGSVQFDGGLAWEGEITLSLPGSDLLSVVLSPGGAGWTALWCRIVLGPSYELTIIDATVALRISETLLADVASGGPAELRFETSLSVTPEGITALGPVTVDLAPAEIAGTGITVAAAGVSLVTGNSPLPVFVDNAEFEGIAIAEGTITLPADWFTDDTGKPIELAVLEAAIGSTGFTGGVSVARGEAGAPDTGTFAGFPARFQSVSVGFVDSAIDQAELALDIRLPVLEDGDERWIRLAASFATDGSLTASLAAVQDGGGDGHLVSFEIAGALRVGLDALTVARDDAGSWTAIVAGAIAVLADAVGGSPDDPWPELSFTGIGLGGDGAITLADDAGISIEAPVTVDFDLARLSLETVRLGRGSAPGSLMVGLNGGIELLKGLPVGVSVEGLAIEVTPGGGPAKVSLDGIGMAIGVPGTFNAELAVGWVSDGAVTEFRGRGALAVPPLDIDVQVDLLVGRDHAGGFNYVQIFADARLMPTGIPVGSTGLAIYGLQGLVTRNRTPAWNPQIPVDERYYALYAAAPIGITDVDKWRNEEGQHALGVGIVIGTLDRGFLFSTKGLVVVAFPDLALLVQSRSDLLAVAPELAAATEGTINSLLVYASAQRALSFDLDVGFEIPAIVSIEGNAGAFFDFDDPAAWYVELGRDRPGERMTASVFGWEGSWLFTAGAWFRVDAEALDTGVRVDVDLIADKAGFWIGAAGYGTAGMHLAWNPLQWEGNAGFGLTVGAGYRKVAISFRFDGAATVTIPAPTALDLTIRACVSLLVTDICKSFRFQWELPSVPEVTSPEGPRFAAARHYTVHPDPADPGRQLDGVVALVAGPAAGPGPRVELNSALTIEFDRPMVDLVGFNEGIALPDGGYRMIGERSNWSSASELAAIALVRDPDGAAEPVPLWGTWALDTLEQNTRLRLFSSERFDHDGSLTTSFASAYTIDYCAEPETTRACLSLRGLQLGYQWLDDGVSIAGWLGEYQNPDTDTGVVLGGDSTLQLYLPHAAGTVTVTLYRPSTDSTTDVPVVLDSGVLTLTDDISRDFHVTQVCWDRGHSGYQWSATHRSGVIVTETEAWTVPAEELLLRPDSVYQLTVTTRTRRRAPNGQLDTPLGDVTTVNRFHTTGPPDHDGALNTLVTTTVPAHGDRAVYRGYDLAVTFVDAYVPYLWTSVGAELRVRLVDAAGNPVLSADGVEALVTIAASGAAQHTVTTQLWDQFVETFRDGPCLPVEPPPLPLTAVNIQYVSGDTLAGLLAPNTRYEAQVVSTDDLARVLHRWTFTTGRHATFTEAVTSRRELRAARRSTSVAVGGGDFDAEARALGLATIAYVDHLTFTPVLDRSGRRILAWLVEAPEPLEPTTRLTIRIGGRVSRLVANGDGTRLLAVPRVPAAIVDTEVALTWERDPSGLPPRTVAGIGGPELVVFTFTAGAIGDGELTVDGVVMDPLGGAI